MIKKKNEQLTEVRDAMRGGSGSVTIRHFFKKDEFNAKSRLCAELIIPPGAGIGEHEHNEEDEVYLIRKGTAIITDNGEEIEVGPGDAILTGNSSSHAIRNSGETDLVLIAVIMQY